MKIKNFKKTLITSIVIVCFMASNAFAIIPLIYLAGSVVLHTAVVAGLTWLAYKSTKTGASNSADGSVSLASQAVWIDLTTTNLPVQKSANVSVNKTFTQIKTEVTANPTKYPALKKALDGADPPPGAKQIGTDGSYTTASASAGDYFISGGTKYVVSSATPAASLGTGSNQNCGMGSYYMSGDPYAPTYTSVTAPDYVLMCNHGTADAGNITYSSTATIIRYATQAPSTAAQFTANIGGTTVNPDAVADMEKLIPNTGGIPSAVVKNNADPKVFSASTYTQPTAVTTAQVASFGGAPAGDASAASGAPQGLSQADIKQGTTDALNASGIKDAVNAVKDAVGTGWAALVAAINSIGSSIVAAVNAASNAISSAVNAVGTAVGLVKTSVDNVKTSVDAGTTATNGVKGSVDGVKGSVDGLGGKLDTANGLLGDIKTGLASGGSGGGTGTGGGLSKSDTTGAVTDALNNTAPSRKADNTQAIKDALGTGTAPTGAMGDKYGSGDSEKYDFGKRLTDFTADMKKSTLFSMPSKLTLNTPTGGSPLFDVNFGRFGSGKFDLSWFSASFAVMRSVIMIMFSFAAFKIVALKGGSN
jgi:hypothetical protein